MRPGPSRLLRRGVFGRQQQSETRRGVALWHDNLGQGLIEEGPLLFGVTVDRFLKYQNQRVIVDREALVGEAPVHGEPRLPVARHRRRPGQAGAAERVVGDGDTQQVRIRALPVDQIEAQLAAEQQVVVGRRQGIALRQPGDGPILPVAVEEQVVGPRQAFDHRPPFDRCVGVVDLHAELVVPPQVAEPLFPAAVLKDGGAGRDVFIDPRRGGLGRVRPGVDADVGDGIEQREHHGDAQGGVQEFGPHEPRAVLAHPAHGPGCQCPAHDGQERRDGQHVAHELHVEEPGDEEVGRNPGEEQDVLPPAFADRHHHAEQQPAPQEQPRREPHAPDREMPHLVEKRRGVDVLACEGEIDDAAHHLALGADVAPKRLEVDDAVGLGDDERRQGHRAGETDAFDRLPNVCAEQRAGLPSSIDVEDSRRHEGQGEGRGARLGRQGDAEEDGGQAEVLQPAAVHRPGEKEERAHQHRRQHDVGDEEVALLDVQGRQSDERRAQQPGPAIEQPRADDVDEQDGGDVEDGRGGPAHDGQLLEARIVQERRRQVPRELEQVQRQGAIGEPRRVEPAIGRKERGEVAGGKGEVVDAHQDRAFVGMVEAALVPVDPIQPEEQGQAGEQRQDYQVAP